MSCLAPLIAMVQVVRVSLDGPRAGQARFAVVAVRPVVGTQWTPTVRVRRIDSTYSTSLMSTCLVDSRLRASV